MSKLALLIIIVSLLVSKNSIEGDRNVNHRSLQSGKIQDLQPVNYFGTYLSRDKPINHSGDQGKEKRRSFLNEKRHQPLKSKPDPEIIPTIEKRKFFRGLLKILYGKSLFFLWGNLNLGRRYQPRVYRRLLKNKNKIKRLKKRKKRQKFKKEEHRKQYDSYEKGKKTFRLWQSNFNEWSPAWLKKFDEKGGNRGLTSENIETSLILFAPSSLKTIELSQ